MKTTHSRYLRFYKWLVAAFVLLVPRFAAASFLHGETLDKAADVMAKIILVVVPIVGIVVFWMVHIIPEKIAEKRHHPQKEAINILCLLSLVFGGLLWPLAWLWAFTKPTGYKLAYGTDKHDDYYKEKEEEERKEADAAVAVPVKKSNVEDEVRVLREKLAATEAKLAVLQAKEESKE